jgi:hypothetical protein
MFYKKLYTTKSATFIAETFILSAAALFITNALDIAITVISIGEFDKKAFIYTWVFCMLLAWLGYALKLLIAIYLNTYQQR